MIFSVKYQRIDSDEDITCDLNNFIMKRNGTLNQPSVDKLALVNGKIDIDD
jgi:hypothetical protein